MTAPAALGKGIQVAAIAETILDAVVRHYQAAPGVTLPDRRVIAPGNSRLIAWDAEQTVVTLSGIGIGSAAGENAGPKSSGNPISATGLRHAVFAVQIVRCSPESEDGTTPPPADEVTAAGTALMRDAGLLSQALIGVVTEISAAVPRGSRVQAGAVEVLGPLGGFAAVEGTIAVTAPILALGGG